jgi:hypothetical protein
MKATPSVLFLELNEINFDFVRRYCEAGMLPNLAGLLKRYPLHRTVSEKKYEEIEPWIQWVTAHTGMSLSEHGVFRLGDIINTDIDQIWEQLERSGVRVGAVSPMNAKNRLEAPAFFIPDPWTRTKVSAGPVAQDLYAAICVAVNENASGSFGLGVAWRLVRGMLAYARPRNYPKYLKYVLGSLRGAPWRRALFLDLLLGDLFVREVRNTSPQFASLFLNAGAHIQHHYMFCSSAYGGDRRNPDWYIKAGLDPVREVLELYDELLGTLLRGFPNARVMLATGLHQDPHEKMTYYWRLRKHDEFLRKIGVPFVEVEGRMSRDFLVRCESPDQALVAQKRIESAKAADGSPLFEVDNRGVDLFVMLVYPDNIDEKFTYTVGTDSFGGLASDVVFVAIKNGKHNGIGYFLDTGARAGESACEFPLASLPSRVKEAVLGSADSAVVNPSSRRFQTTNPS